MYSPIDISNARLHRRLLMRTMPLIAAVTRNAWRYSKSSCSTWYGETRLWRSLWKINRALGGLPRYDSHEVEVQVSSRVRMCLNLARLTDAFAYCFGIGESEIGFLCTLFCAADSVILDVGANIGTATLFFAETVSSGKVHAFEPSSAMRSALTTNISLSGFRNIHVHPYGLSDVSDSGWLQRAMAGNPGSSYFTKSNLSGSAEARAELRALDEVIILDEQIDLIKIDVEGYEYRVLLGGNKLVLRYKPVLIVEVNEAALIRAGSSSSQVCQVLNEWGYRFFCLEQGRFCEYALDNAQGLHNLIAVHPLTRFWQVVELHQ